MRVLQYFPKRDQQNSPIPNREMTSTILSLIMIAMNILVNRVNSVGNCVGNISLSEFQGLQALYDSTHGENWTWNLAFPPATVWHFSTSNLTLNNDLYAPCQDFWQGLSCSYNKAGLCSIQNISLAGMNLVGSIPYSLSQCKNIEVSKTKLIIISNSHSISFSLTYSLPLSLL